MSSQTSFELAFMMALALQRVPQADFDWALLRLLELNPDQTRAREAILEVTDELERRGVFDRHKALAAIDQARQEEEYAAPG